MFRELIQTPVDPVTMEYLSTLQRPFREPDLTLSMLGLACFKKRVRDYHGINGRYIFVTDFNDYMNSLEIEYISQNKEDISFYYVVYQSTENYNCEILTNLGFKHKETVEKIAKDKFAGANMSVLYSQEKNIAVVITTTRANELYHLSLSFLPLYYPNIYTSPITRNDPEVEVLASLSKPSSSQFKQEISKVLSEYKQEFIYTQISQLMSGMHEARISRAKASVDNAKNDMEYYLEEYCRKVSTYRDAIALYEGMVATEQTTEQEKELVNYLCTNPAIRNVKITGSEITFTVATTLKQFDLDAWEMFANRDTIFDGSYGQTLSGAFANKENRKLLFNAIFSDDPKFEVKMCGVYCINMHNNHFNSYSNYNYAMEDPIYASYIPNPHLQQYACLGDFSRRVVKALSEGDLITALELCVHSAGCVNLDETDQNFRPLLGWILTRNEKVLRRFDGVDMTPSEALLWLADEKENENETDQAE